MDTLVEVRLQAVDFAIRNGTPPEGLIEAAAKLADFVLYGKPEEKQNDQA